MPAPTLQQIRTEIDTDPKSLGYAAMLDDTNRDEAIANRLNELGAANPDETLFKAYTPMEDILAAIVLADYTALSATAKTTLEQFTRGPKLKSGDANMRATMAGIFPVSTTRTNLINISSRVCTRAEFLWGEGTFVNNVDVAQALELP